MAEQRSAVGMRVTSGGDLAGVVIPVDVLENRFGFLSKIVLQLSESLLADLWSEATLATLVAGVDGKGRAFPQSASVVADRMNWSPTPIPGVHCSSRVYRLAQANAVQILRGQASREALFPAVLAAMTPAGTINRTQLPADAAFMTQDYLSNIARQILNARKRLDADPKSIVQIQQRPKMAEVALFGVADRQFADLEVHDSHLQVTALLPTCAAPTKADWAWHRVLFRIPAHVAAQHRRIVSWHLPALSIDDTGRAMFRFAVTTQIPDPATDVATHCLGIDWSPQHLGVAGVARQDPAGRLWTDGRSHTYNDRGLSDKLLRLQRGNEELTAKITRIGELAVGHKNPPARARLEDAIEKLKAQRTLVGRKRNRINRELAFHFAAAMVDLATTSGCTVIAVEDLSSLTAGGIGRYNNNKTAQSARAAARDAITHTAGKAGIEVITCPARGTSANCPRCDTQLTRPAGHYTAVCQPCGIDTDRDTVAAQNIAKRVLLGKTKVVRPRGKPAKVAVAAHIPVGISRDKLLATARQPRHKRCRPTPVPTRPAGRTPASKPARIASTRGTAQAKATRVQHESLIQAPSPGS